ncbi:MAG TPA: hypothetical protein VGU02_05025 [Gaiellaceae bacterium]|nr:hypothetical protein [Gaiellaceae bacterium]
MRRLALLTGVVAAVALAAATGASAAGPLRVTTSITPGWAYFADTITARLELVVDRSQIDAGSIQVAAPFAPWEQVGEPKISTAETPETLERSIVYTLRCLDFACLPRGTTVERFQLPVVTVTAESTSQASEVVKRPWPPVRVSGRFLPPVIGSVRPQLLRETGARPIRFAVSPRRSALVFDLAGAALGLAALALAAVELTRYRARRRSAADDRPPLVRALDLIREARSRDEADRRRAVALLARLLPEPGAERSAATEIAWSKPTPSPEELDELAEHIEETLVRKS